MEHNDQIPKHMRLRSHGPAETLSEKAEDRNTLRVTAAAVRTYTKRKRTKNDDEDDLKTPRTKSAKKACATDATTEQPPHAPRANRLPHEFADDRILHIDWTNSRGSVYRFVDYTHADARVTVGLTLSAHGRLGHSLVPVCLVCRKNKLREFPAGDNGCGCLAELCGPSYCKSCLRVAYREMINRGRRYRQWLDPKAHRSDNGHGKVIAEQLMEFNYNAVTRPEICSELIARRIPAPRRNATKEQLVGILQSSDRKANQLCPCGRAASMHNGEVKYCGACGGYVVQPRQMIYKLGGDPLRKNKASTGKLGPAYGDHEKERLEKEKSRQPETAEHDKEADDFRKPLRKLDALITAYISEKDQISRANNDERENLASTQRQGEELTPLQADCRQSCSSTREVTNGATESNTEARARVTESSAVQPRTKNNRRLTSNKRKSEPKGKASRSMDAETAGPLPEPRRCSTRTRFMSRKAREMAEDLKR